MDAIVVDTEKTGKDCIQYLREQVGRYRPTSISYFFLLAPLPGLQKLQHAEGFTLHSKRIQSLRENGLLPLAMFKKLTDEGSLVSYQSVVLRLLTGHIV